MPERIKALQHVEKPIIHEIRIRKVSELTPEAQQEVVVKLRKQRENFKYRGFAKVNYVKNSPLTIYSVDPIEGTAVDFFKSISENIMKI